MNNATCEMLSMIDFAAEKGLIEAEDKKSESGRDAAY